MNRSFETKNWKWSYARFLSAPLGFRAFAVFSVFASLSALLVIFDLPKDIRERIVPFTGWAYSSMYMFGLFFTLAILFLKDNKGVYRLRLLFGIAGPLFIYSMISIYQLLALKNPYSNDFESPYQELSSWQPAWTIIIPMLWILVLFSSSTRRFCQLQYH